MSKQSRQAKAVAEKYGIDTRLTWDKIKKNFYQYRGIYLMLIPVLAFYIVFNYAPLQGLQIAFRNYRPGRGIWGSAWVGLANFKQFFTGPYFWRVLRNTLYISFYTIVICFPAPILFALMLNELRLKKLKSAIQTVSYLPHFISLVVVCGIIKEFVSSTGLISNLLAAGGMASNLLMDPSKLRAIYVVSELWQTIGWNSIIYLAALAGINQELYDAAAVDGAGRFRRILSITIPCLMPTIIIMFIMRIGQFMSVGYDKIILLYNENIYETADIIGSFVYRKGLIESNYSYSMAVSLVNSLVNFLLVVVVNKISAKVSETSLW